MYVHMYHNNGTKATQWSQHVVNLLFTLTDKLSDNDSKVLTSPVTNRTLKHTEK